MDTDNAPPPTASRSYEFDQQENACLEELGTSMRRVGIVYVIAGVLAGIYFYPLIKNSGGDLFSGYFNMTITAAPFVATTLLLIIKGLHLWLAGSYFLRVVSTKGNDIKNLMEALGDLKGVYDFHWWFPLALSISLAAAAVNALR